VSLEVRIEGADLFRQVAQQMRAESAKGMARQMATALSKVAEPVKVEITRETLAAMPSEGGYRGLMSASLEHRMSRRMGGRHAQLIIATYAEGTKERRDIKALNRGILRHPVYGRSRKIKVGVRAGTIIPNPWAVTSVNGGFHERGTARAMARARVELAVVLDDFAGRLVG
jgi:hypothetical protein